MGDKKAEKAAESALIEAWWPLCEFAAYELNRSGDEGLVLSCLAQFPKTAWDIATEMSEVDDSYVRCIAALIPAFVPAIHPSALTHVWDQELKRLKLMTEKEGARMAAMESNSVAERVVKTGGVWLADPRLHDAAATVLTDMVRRAAQGEDWNTSNIALGLLMKHKAKGVDELVKAYVASDYGKKRYPKHVEGYAKGVADPCDEFQHMTVNASSEDELPEEIAAAVEQLRLACAGWEPFAAANCPA